MLWPTFISASVIVGLQAVQQINAITSFRFVIWKLKQSTVHTTRGACYVRLIGNKPLFLAHPLGAFSIQGWVFDRRCVSEGAFRYATFSIEARFRSPSPFVPPRGCGQCNILWVAMYACVFRGNHFSKRSLFSHISLSLFSPISLCL
jgi:hypothetical protein